jgi:hypothetical protein
LFVRSIFFFVVRAPFFCQATAVLQAGRMKGGSMHGGGETCGCPPRPSSPRPHGGSEESTPPRPHTTTTQHQTTSGHEGVGDPRAAAARTLLAVPCCCSAASNSSSSSVGGRSGEGVGGGRLGVWAATLGVDAWRLEAVGGHMACACACACVRVRVRAKSGKVLYVS